MILSVLHPIGESRAYSQGAWLKSEFARPRICAVHRSLICCGTQIKKREKPMAFGFIVVVQEQQSQPSGIPPGCCDCLVGKHHPHFRKWQWFLQELLVKEVAN